MYCYTIFIYVMFHHTSVDGMNWMNLFRDFVGELKSNRNVTFNVPKDSFVPIEPIPLLLRQSYHFLPHV